MSDNNTAGLGRVPEGQKAAYDAALAELTSNLTTYDAPPPRPTGSNFARHAWDELVRVGAFTADTDFYGGMTGRAIMELIETFAAQGHSGASAPTVIAAFAKLASFEPLTALTDDPDEWQEVADGLWQSCRKPDAFSRDGGRTYRVTGDRDTVHRTEPARDIE